MVQVIVAGGTSPTLGRAIVKTCLAAGNEVTILSRTPKESSTAPKSAHGAAVRYVSYDNVDDIKPALAGANVVISVLKIIGDELNLTTHLNLLQASLATDTVTRFVPSDWSMYSLANKQVDLLAHKTALLNACQELAASSPKPGFEIALFKNGGFLNYFAQRAPSITTKPSLLAGLEDDLMLAYIDIAAGTLPIPVDDNGDSATVSMTHIDDIGVYVAAAIALPPGSWPASGIINITGSTFTYTEVRQILESECGMHITHAVVSPADCARYKAEADKTLAEKGFDLEAFKAGMVAQMQAVICRGQKGGAWADNMLADLCPDVKPVDFREYLLEVWGRK